MFKVKKLKNWKTENCAADRNSRFWFNACMKMNPNGPYKDPASCEPYKNIHWYAFKGQNYCLKTIEMAIKRFPWVIQNDRYPKITHILQKWSYLKLEPCSLCYDSDGARKCATTMRKIKKWCELLSVRDRSCNSHLVCTNHGGFKIYCRIGPVVYPNLDLDWDYSS